LSKVKEGLVIQPVTAADLFTITRMAYTNMVGADEDFTRLLSNRLSRWAAYVVLPLYLLVSGQGYKAVWHGRIAGCAFLDLRERSGYVFNVSVNAAHRRHGVATELMDHLEHVARSQNRRWLALHVDKNNTPAWSLYERLGYRVYHPLFLRHRRPQALPLPLPSGQVTVEPAGRGGRERFKQLAALERSAGDAWADQVVTEEYSLTPPASGSYWRCRYEGEEVGYAWSGSADGQAMLFLLLRPAYWGHTATVSLLSLLWQRMSQPADYLDVHVGSSRHFATAAPLLQPLGFEEVTQKRVLMLKPVT
jgi:GNAT superfamily N-acetyltransferase